MNKMTNTQREAIEEGVGLILHGLFIDPSADHNFDKTPKRFARVLEEMFFPPEIEIPVFDENYTDIVMLRHHIFYTLCPHHLLPVRLDASIAYKPRGRVIGASKLARLMQEANRGPLTQEALTARILDSVQELTNHTSDGAIIHIAGEHGCFRIRGIRSACADMVTLKYYGCFESVEEREAFLTLLTLNGR